MQRPASEFVPVPDRGRRFVSSRRVRLGDVDPAGHLRLDAIARYLQDVAADDVEDSGLAGAFGWVVRRTMIRVGAPAVLGEDVELTTWSSGFGRSWAERRTRISGSGAHIDAVCLWVRVDASTGRPTMLDDDFHRLYGAANGGRRGSARLELGAADAEAERELWPLRAVDLDVLGHVNNAVHWAVVEELLARSGQERRGIGEVEHPAPIAGGQPVLLSLRAGEGLGWLESSGATCTATRWTAAV